MKRSLAITLLASFSLIALLLCPNPVQAKIPEDLNQDGKVDIEDIAIAAQAFGSYPGHLRWNPEADLDGDGKVSIIDIAIIAKAFGKIG